METLRPEKDTILYLPEIIRQSGKKHSERIAAGIADSFTYTYKELYELSMFVATTLYGLDVKPGDRTIILSENTPHWVAAWFGTMINGGVTVPILIDFQGKEIWSIIEHSGSTVLFVSSKMLPKLKDGIPSNIKHVILTDDFSHLEHRDGKIIYTEAKANGIKKLSIDTAFLEDESSFFKGQPDDLASII